MRAPLHTNGRRQIKRCKRTDSFMLASTASNHTAFSIRLSSKWTPAAPLTFFLRKRFIDACATNKYLVEILEFLQPQRRLNKTGFEAQLRSTWSVLGALNAVHPSQKGAFERAFIAHDTCATRAVAQTLPNRRCQTCITAAPCEKSGCRTSFTKPIFVTPPAPKNAFYIPRDMHHSHTV